MRFTFYLNKSILSKKNEFISKAIFQQFFNILNYFLNQILDLFSL